MDNKVEELSSELTEPSTADLEIIGNTEVMYVNKSYAAICNEGVIKLYFANLNNNGAINNIEGVVMTLGVLHALQGTINDVLKKIANMQSNVVPINNKPNREILN